jgi:hypothetical protein
MTSIPEGRIGDYIIEHALDAPPGELAYAATHVLLPRRARLVVAESHHQTVAMQVMRYACLVEALRHPAVPRVFECGVMPDRRPWVATELIEGRVLADLDQPLVLHDVIVLMRDLAEALEYVHGRGVVHGGLRLDHVVWSDGALKIACWDSASPGTDHSADIHLLGHVVYFALTCALPILPVARRCPGAPGRLTTLLDRMLATQGAVRPTAAEVRAEAELLVDYVEPELVEDDGIPIEVDDVVLVDISRDPPPLPRVARLKWTPETGYLPQQAQHGSTTRKKTPVDDL